MSGAQRTEIAAESIVDSQPRVLCILPYHRSEYVEKAFSCFASQTYPHKRLMAMDTSRSKDTIGAIRNWMIEADTKPDLIAHWDHDDWSAPDRLASQVKFLHSSGASVVGYSDLPFYDVPTDRVLFYRSGISHYAVGTSLLYKREAWERVPFPDSMMEDCTWLHQIGFQFGPQAIQSESSLRGGKPWMIARAHSGSTQRAVYGDNFYNAANFEKPTAELDREVRRLLI